MTSNWCYEAPCPANCFRESCIEKQVASAVTQWSGVRPSYTSLSLENCDDLRVRRWVGKSTAPVLRIMPLLHEHIQLLACHPKRSLYEDSAPSPRQAHPYRVHRELATGAWPTCTAEPHQQSGAETRPCRLNHHS